ncbi:MAG: molybdate transport system substrate-binding protein [Actinomycetota bacterium]
MRRGPRWLLALLALVALGAAGCGGDDDDTATSASTTSTTAGAVSGNLAVFAASSLTEAFTAMGKDFEAAHPDLKVTFNFAASSALAQQVNDGGPADVLVTADESNMKKVTDADNATDPKTFARNRLAILVEKGNPKDITGLEDLAESDVVFVLCAPEVPCGKFGAAALTKAGVTAKPASLEDNVKAVVSKVTLGEADAGIVYVTDVKAAADKAQGVDIDIADDPTLEAVYPIAVTKQVVNNAAATAWIDFVLSADGQKTLASYGFLAP